VYIYYFDREEDIIIIMTSTQRTLSVDMF